MAWRRGRGGKRRRPGAFHGRRFGRRGSAGFLFPLLVSAGISLVFWWAGLVTPPAEHGGPGEGRQQGSLRPWEPVTDWLSSGWEQLRASAAGFLPQLNQRLATDEDFPRYLLGQGLPLAHREHSAAGESRSAGGLGRELQAVLEQVADYPLDDPHGLVVRHFPGGRFRTGPDGVTARDLSDLPPGPRESSSGEPSSRELSTGFSTGLSSSRGSPGGGIGSASPVTPGVSAEGDRPRLEDRSGPGDLRASGTDEAQGSGQRDVPSGAAPARPAVRFEAVGQRQSGLARDPGAGSRREAARGELPADSATITWGPEPLVAILHAHTSEMYRTDDFAPPHPDDYHRFNAQDTGILQVGEAMAQRLQEHGVGVIHSRRIHDYPVHPLAYREARKTVQELIQRYPSLVLILDVHRDSPAGLTTTVAGEAVGQVMILVGSGEATRGLANPTWRSNFQVAQELEAILRRRYPGLHRRTWVRPDARFNQDLHPGMLLLEIGSYDTHIQEAMAAARMVADAVVEWLLTHHAPGAGR